MAEDAVDAPLALVIGRAGEDRPLIEQALRDAALLVSSTSFEDAMGGRGLGSPRLVVLDDGSAQVERETLQMRLLSHPQMHGAPLLVISDECTVESFSGAISKGAAAYVTRPLDPSDLTNAAVRLATWPRGMAGRNGRLRARRPLLLDVDFEVEGQVGRARGLILDVSSGGCRMELPHAVPRGATLSFVPRACERSTEIRLSGRVRWYRRTEDGHHLAAIRFAGAGGMLAGQILGAVPRRLAEPR
jgi:hypothetical protein